jgi:hypothetical protein
MLQKGPFGYLTDNCCYKRILPVLSICPNSYHTGLRRLEAYLLEFDLSVLFAHLSADDMRSFGLTWFQEFVEVAPKNEQQTVLHN